MQPQLDLDYQARCRILLQIGQRVLLTALVVQDHIDRGRHGQPQELGDLVQEFGLDAGLSAQHLAAAFAGNRDTMFELARRVIQGNLTDRQLGLDPSQRN